MMGKTHQVGGVSAALITSTALYFAGSPLIEANPELIPAVVAGGWLGGLMPDIDHPNSTVSNMKILGIPLFRPIAWLINVLFGHRGATHTLWALFLTWLPIVMLPAFLPPEWGLASAVVTLFGIGYAVGYLSHLLLDSLTPSGTPMLWPLPPVHLARIRTGHYEGLVQAGLVLITAMSCGGMIYFFG